MSLSTLCIRRPVLAIVLNLAILLFGFIGYRSLGTNEFPAVDPPVVTVNTRYTGANAEIVESQITEPLEKAINGIEGIRNISSSSNLGSSSITVEFDLNANLESAANDVRDKVSEAIRNLPLDIDAPPVVQKSDAANMILAVCLKSESHNIMQLNEYAENSVIPRLQTIPGVSSIRNFSTKKYSMRLRLDPSKMAAQLITAADIKRALDRENVELPSGKIYGQSNELVIKTAGRLFTENDFNQLILRVENGQVIRFQDVGVAEIAPENEENAMRVNGVFMTGFGINPQPGANYIAIADEFYKRFDQLKREMPPGFDLFVSMDNTEFVRHSIDEVKETILIAVILVVLVIYFFFRDWVVAFRPLIDIPVSLIGAFFIMYLAGFTINVLTLLAIVLATGLVVDDGIVVTENIYKKIEAGMKPVEAAIKGANEILFAVLSTSTTLAVVFLPLLFLEGFVGKLFVEFGVTIAGAVLISAFVSLTLTPMLNAYLVRKHAKPSWFYRKTEPFFEKMESGYSNSLGNFLHRRWLAFPIIAGVVWMIFYFGNQLPNELAPLEDRGGFRMSVTAPESSSYDFTDFIMQKVGAFAMDSMPEADVVMAITVPGFTGSGATNTGFVRIKLNDDKNRRSQQEIVNMVGRNLRKFPEARIFPIQEQTISVGGGSRFGLPVQYVLKAPTFEKLKEKLPQFLEEAKKSPAFQGVDANLKFNLPELDLTIDRDKARALGVNVADVAQTIQLSIGGIRYGYFTIAGKQYQIIGQLDRTDRDQPADISKLFVKNAAGEMMRLDNLLTMRESASPPQLYHFNRYMSATVSASLAPGFTIGDGLNVMDSVAAKVLDPTFSTDVSGPSRDFRESSSNIQFTFILALLLIFLVLAAQFESFIDPFIILFTVPLAIGGAVFSLWYFNLTLNIFSQIGILMLIGLVTKNGILIVEFANQLRERGMEKQAAIREAARLRLRPILMTSIATALGALPIALALGAGAQSRVPMGVVIVGGLMFSLVLTLYVIPAMYSFLSGKKQVVESSSPVLASILVVFACTFFPSKTTAQQIITPAEAIAIALENNLGIQITENERQIAKNNATRANAGGSAEVNFVAGIGGSNVNTNQKFADGRTQNRKFASAANGNAGVQLNWTLYDGKRMFRTLDRLNALVQLSDFQLQVAAENLTTDVLLTFSEAVRQSQIIAATKKNLQFYDERIRLAQARVDAGTVGKPILLQNQIDKNVQESLLLQAENALAALKIQLNLLMLKPSNEVFNLPDSLFLNENLTLDEFMQAAETSNRQVRLAQQQVKIAEISITEAEALYKPQIDLNAGYNFARSQNQAGVFLFSQNYGLTAGVTLTYNIFNGHQTRRQVQNAKLVATNAQLFTQENLLQIKSSIALAFSQWQTARQMIVLENRNLELTRENLKISEDRFRLGGSDILPLREAQKSFEDAQIRLINARQQAKLGEIRLFQLSGRL